VPQTDNVPARIIMTDSINLLRLELHRRFWTPMRSVTFHTHLLVSIVAGGGLGIWYSCWRIYCHESTDISEISSAAFTYFPAIVAPVLLDLSQEDEPFMRSFAWLAALAFFCLFFWCIHVPPGICQLFLAVICALLSILFWWVVNGDNERFKDLKKKPSEGGPLQTPLTNGNDTGWKK
jgi:uncharacterized membrane protein